MCLPPAAAAAIVGGAQVAQGVVQRNALQRQDAFNKQIAARNRELLLERNKLNQRALARRQLEVNQALASTLEELQRTVTGATAEVTAQAATTGTAGTSVLEVNQALTRALLESGQNAKRNALAQQRQLEAAKSAQNIDLAQALLSSSPPPLTIPEPFSIALQALGAGAQAYFQNLK